MTTFSESRWMGSAIMLLGIAAVLVLTHGTDNALLGAQVQAVSDRAKSVVVDAARKADRELFEQALRRRNRLIERCYDSGGTPVGGFALPWSMQVVCVSNHCLELPKE